eukprot:SAG11_NODE_1530_length_4737_cov_3.232643_1_plen_126_part_00
MNSKCVARQRGYDSRSLDHDPDMFAATQGRGELARTQMLAASPKYIPREWLLAEAYNAADQGDHAPLHKLQDLLRHPYVENSAAAAAHCATPTRRPAIQMTQIFSSFQDTCELQGLPIRPSDPNR